MTPHRTDLEDETPPPKPRWKRKRKVKDWRKLRDKRVRELREKAERERKVGTLGATPTRDRVA